MDLVGTPLDVALYPSTLTLDEQGGEESCPGARRRAGARHHQRLRRQPTGSTLADVGWLTLDRTAPDSSLPYDAGVYIGAGLLGSASTCAGPRVRSASMPARSPPTLACGDGLPPCRRARQKKFEALFPESQPVTLLLSAPTPLRSEFDDDGAPLHAWSTTTSTSTPSSSTARPGSFRYRARPTSDSTSRSTTTP